MRTVRQTLAPLLGAAAIAATLSIYSSPSSAKPLATAEGGFFDTPRIGAVGERGGVGMRINDAGEVHLVHAASARKGGKLARQFGGFSLFRYTHISPDGVASTTELPSPKGGKTARFMPEIATISLDADGQPGILAQLNGDQSVGLCLATRSSEGQWEVRETVFPALGANAVLGRDAAGGWLAASFSTPPLINAGGQPAGPPQSKIVRWDGKGAAQATATRIPAAPAYVDAEGKLVTVDATGRLAALDGNNAKSLGKAPKRVPHWAALPRPGASTMIATWKRGTLSVGELGGELQELDPEDAEGDHDLALLPDGRVLIVWAYSTGPEEKGVRAAVGDGTDWSAWKQLWSADDTIGWQVNVDVNSKGQIALAYTNRSENRVEVHVFDSLDDMQASKGAFTWAPTAAE